MSNKRTSCPKCDQDTISSSSDRRTLPPDITLSEIASVQEKLRPHLNNRHFRRMYQEICSFMSDLKH